MNEQELAALHALSRNRQSTTERVRHPIVDRIVRSVAIAYGASVNDIVGLSRTKSIAEARAVACLVARRCTRMSYPEIGRALGLHHTSVIAAVRKVEGRRANDRWLNSACAVLLDQFGAFEESKEQ